MTFFAQLIIGAFVLYVLWRLFASDQGSDDYVPPELRPRKLFAIEKDFYTDTQHGRIFGRPDAVYETSRGMLVPVELKTHNYIRVFDSDRAQLSLQAWMLRRAGHKTARFGFVRAVNRQTNNVKWLRVDLATDNECEGLINRYIQLMSGTVIPVKSTGPKCKSCGHLDACKRI